MTANIAKEVGTIVRENSRLTKLVARLQAQAAKSSGKAPAPAKAAKSAPANAAKAPAKSSGKVAKPVKGGKPQKASKSPKDGFLL